MKTLTKILATGILGLSLASCSSLKPKTSLDIAYIPIRYDDKEMKNEIMIDVGLGIESKISNRLSLELGGNSRTYLNPFLNGIYSNPTRQGYDLFLNFDINKAFENVDLQFYAFHNCTHPVKDKEFWITENGEDYYIINHDSISKIGIKLKLNE
jgi:hypothetical protein